MERILIYPNKILRRKTNIVEKVDANLIGEIKVLKKQLMAAENGAGLAAPQIGISKRFFGIKDQNKKVKIFINPKIGKTFGKRIYPKMVDEKDKEEDFLEGCLSFPDIFGTVKRYLEISVEWVEIKGDKFVSNSKKLAGFEAIVWQHETDHLDGILFVDYVKKESGKIYKWAGEKMVEWNINKII
jgi:peptide deformylase